MPRDSYTAQQDIARERGLCWGTWARLSLNAAAIRAVGYSRARTLGILDAEDTGMKY